MKKALSISVGSTRRNHRVVVNLLGEDVEIERRGTDGDFEAAAELYREMDGKVDAFGVGGVDLGVTVFGVHYPLYDALRVVRHVKKTPYADGGGLKNTLERRAIPYAERMIPQAMQPRRALVCSGVDRFGMGLGFFDAGYRNDQVVYGDLMFALGLPIAIRGGPQSLARVARLIMPVAGRLPMKMLYPTGKDQEKHTPKYQKWFEWAQVIAGDCIYITRYGPDNMSGKVVVTNTTTAADVELFRKRGVRYLVTTTPRLAGGRSFGTNAMEAALIAASGKGRTLTSDELDAMIDELGMAPSIEQLNE